MSLFTQDIEKVQEDIDTGLAELFRLKNPDKIKDTLSFVNFLNEYIICTYPNTHKLNRKNIDEACSLYKQLIGIYRINSRYSKNLKNIAENYGFLSIISKKILPSMNEEIEVDENIQKKEQYTDKEMLNIIKKYYIEQLDFESLELLRYLTSTHSIYDIKLGEEFGGLSLRSGVLDKNYIIIPNHHNFDTIVNLIHEIKHIEEWLKIEKVSRLIKYREYNNLVEVGPQYAEKKFIEYSSRDQEFRKEAINRHYMNYRSLKYQLENFEQLFSSLSEDKNPNIARITYSYNSIFGDIISDVLLSKSSEEKNQFFENLSQRKNLLLDYFDFDSLKFTPSEIASNVAKQYKKYK